MPRAMRFASAFVRYACLDRQPRSMSIGALPTSTGPGTSIGRQSWPIVARLDVGATMGAPRVTLGVTTARGARAVRPRTSSRAESRSRGRSSPRGRRPGRSEDIDAAPTVDCPAPGASCSRARSPGARRSFAPRAGRTSWRSRAGRSTGSRRTSRSSPAPRARSEPAGTAASPSDG